MMLIIIFQRGETDRQRPGIAKRPQAHVDAEYLTIGSGLMQHIDQLLPQTDEEGLVIQRPSPALSLTILWKAEDQIDVGGKVELAPTELAHAQHDQRLCYPFGADRRPLLTTGSRVEPGQSL